jgi:hypothetical protein
LSMTEPSNLEMVSSKEEISEAGLQREWEDLMDTSGTPYAVYGSPAWILHLKETSDTPVRVWKMRDTEGALVGLVPVALGEYHLSFEVASRSLLRIPLRTAHVLGGLPVLPRNGAHHLQLFDAVFSEFPETECIHFETVPTDHWLSEFFLGDGEVQKQYSLHSPFGVRKWHLLRIEGSFEDYLGGMGGKSRNTLRRKVRQLEKRDDKLEIRRVDHPAQVPPFLEAASEISRNSWQQRVLGERVSDNEQTRRSLMDLAERGLLRSYLLTSGGDPCAFLIGYHYRGVFNSGELGFHQRFADYSPGTVLWYLLLEDLHADPSMTLLNFGMGDAAYKRRFGNAQSSDSSWLVMGRSIRNRLLARSHAAFDGSVELVKRIVGRGVEE